MRTFVLFASVGLTGLLASCVGMPGDSMGGDFRLPPVPVPVGGGGYAPAAPAQPAPMAPPISAIQQYNEPGQIEVHGAVRASDCKDMERRFKQQGRRVTLTKVQRNNIGTGGVLQWMCVFEGPDAQTGWFDDRRYN